MVIGTISRFQLREYDAFYWKIDKFSKLFEKVTCSDCSAGFYFKGHICELRICPNSTSGKPEFFGLYFRSHTCNGSSYAHLTLGLKTRNGRIEKGFSKNIFVFGTNEYGTSALIRQSDFFERKEELAPSDCLTFVALLGPDVVEMIRGVADRIETGHEEEKDNEEKSEKKGSEKVLGDVAKLLASGYRSDALILVEETEFKVHSCILGARTPVFAALFEHDTLEKATRKITITDCEPTIFKEFLNYIYTGSVQDLTAENSFGLYQVADKYLVKDLKEVCRQCIQGNLSTETFCEALKLALKCGDEDLLESAIDYFAKSIRLIIRSVEWQTYIEENPREANEILIKALGPL